MVRKVEPKHGRRRPPNGVRAYVRVTPRMVYISEMAMREWGNTETVNIGVDAPGRLMVFSKGGDCKLSRVCESEHARRIETRNFVQDLLKAGFPIGMLGHYLSCYVDMAGSLIVSLIPDYDRIDEKKENEK